MPTLDATAGDIGAWYDRYLDAFTGLAAGERTDVDARLAFFGVPLVILTEDRYRAGSALAAGGRRRDGRGLRPARRG
jgi:hypothetical protein